MVVQVLTQNEVGAFVGFETEIQEVLLMGEIAQTGRYWEGQGVRLGGTRRCFLGRLRGTGSTGKE